MTAAGTMGTGPADVATPRPCSCRYRITPSAAARPNALPPVRRMASTWRTSRPGASTSVSRVPGAPPRTSTTAGAGLSKSTTVQPVIASWSVQCPAATRIGAAPAVSSTCLNIDSPFDDRAGVRDHESAGEIRRSRGAKSVEAALLPDVAQDQRAGADPTCEGPGFAGGQVPTPIRRIVIRLQQRRFGDEHVDALEERCQRRRRTGVGRVAETRATDRVETHRPAGDVVDRRQERQVQVPERQAILGVVFVQLEDRGEELVLGARLGERLRHPTQLLVAARR